jgi:hypothetical protein
MQVNTPPMWAGRDDPRECAICSHSAGMFFKVHHCRYSVAGGQGRADQGRAGVVVAGVVVVVVGNRVTQ